MNPRPMIIVRGAQHVAPSKALKLLRKFSSTHSLQAGVDTGFTAAGGLRNMFGAFTDDAVDKLESIINELDVSLLDQRASIIDHSFSTYPQSGSSSSCSSGGGILSDSNEVVNEETIVEVRSGKKDKKRKRLSSAPGTVEDSHQIQDMDASAASEAPSNKKQKQKSVTPEVLPPVKAEVAASETTVGVVASEKKKKKLKSEAPNRTDAAEISEQLPLKPLKKLKLPIDKSGLSNYDVPSSTTSVQSTVATSSGPVTTAALALPQQQLLNGSSSSSAMKKSSKYSENGNSESAEKKKKKKKSIEGNTTA